MISLSVVIITYNEEKKIGQCIDSVKSIADEILVVDSFSTDRTESICKEKGARFIQHKFDGHIEQKNYAASQAAYEHILSLDADEALSNELAGSVRTIKENWKMNGYYMNRLTNYCGKWVRHCGWYPDRKLRLFVRSKGHWGGVNPHDRYLLNEGDKSAGFIEGDILHYSYDSVEDHYRQVENFTSIAAKALAAQGSSVSILRVWFAPAIKFLRDYIFKLGFLDGSTGWTICRISAYASGLKYKKLRAINQEMKL